MKKIKSHAGWQEVAKECREGGAVVVRVPEEGLVGQAGRVPRFIAPAPRNVKVQCTCVGVLVWSNGTRSPLLEPNYKHPQDRHRLLKNYSPSRMSSNLIEIADQFSTTKIDCPLLACSIAKTNKIRSKEAFVIKTILYINSSSGSWGWAELIVIYFLHRTTSITEVGKTCYARFKDISFVVFNYKSFWYLETVLLTLWWRHFFLSCY